jgi:hypothetical protein
LFIGIYSVFSFINRDNITNCISSILDKNDVLLNYTPSSITLSFSSSLFPHLPSFYQFDSGLLLNFVEALSSLKYVISFRLSFFFLKKKFVKFSWILVVLLTIYAFINPVIKKALLTEKFIYLCFINVVYPYLIRILKKLLDVMVGSKYWKIREGICRLLKIMALSNPLELFADIDNELSTLSGISAFSNPSFLSSYFVGPFWIGDLLNQKIQYLRNYYSTKFVNNTNNDLTENCPCISELDFISELSVNLEVPIYSSHITNLPTLEIRLSVETCERSIETTPVIAELKFSKYFGESFPNCPQFCSDSAFPIFHSITNYLSWIGLSSQELEYAINSNV